MPQTVPDRECTCKGKGGAGDSPAKSQAIGLGSDLPGADTTSKRSGADLPIAVTSFTRMKWGSFPDVRIVSSDCTSAGRAFPVNLTAKQLYFRLARIKDCAAIRGPPQQPDILDDVLGLRRASENAVLESGAAFA